MLFHAFPAALPGGFVGVDIFFVISGYLITGLLLADLDAHGRIDFAGFYARRIRRIFPALAVVLIATLAFGWFVLIALEFRELGYHAAGATGFVVNFQFASQMGYFDPRIDRFPLLHLWSLAIEEQFYLLWPLILAIASRWRGGIALAIAGLLAASFFWSLTTSEQTPVDAFFLLPSRAWELLAGAVLAWSARSRQLPSRLTDILAALGIAFVIAAVFMIDGRDPYPGWHALLPVAGTAMLIASGPGTILARHFLAQRPVVLIGLISYPLYLWHFPPLAFARILYADTPPASVRLGIIIAAIAAAWLTWRLVEMPIRKRAPSGRTVGPLVGSMLAIAAFALTVGLTEGLPGRAVDRLNTLAQTATLRAGQDTVSYGCVGGGSPSNDEQFCRHDPRLPPAALVWGDSKADSFYWGLIRDSREHRTSGGWQISGGSGCAPTTGRLAVYNPICADINAGTFHALKDAPEIRTVALAAAVRIIASQGYDVIFAEFDQIVDTLLRAGKRVVFIVDNPSVTTEKDQPTDCVRRTPIPGLDWLIGPRICTLSLASHQAATAEYSRHVMALATRHPGLAIVDPADVLCRDGSCPIADGRAMLYSYGDHISDHGSDLVARRINAVVFPDNP